MHSGDGNIFISFPRCKAPAVVNVYHQIFLKIFVEKTIKERVYTCRNHSNQVANYKYQVMLTAHQHLMIPVKDDIEDVQGQPTGPKGHHDGDQYCIDPLILTEPALIFSLPVHLSISPMEADDNLQVADEDEAQRDTVLEHKQGGGEEELVHFGGPALYTGYPVGVEVSREREVVERLLS